jgi:vitamin B12 transporter
VSKEVLLTGGYQYRGASGNSSNLGSASPNKQLTSNAGFAQAQVNLFDRLLFTGGVRQDSYNIFGDATTYRLTGGYLHQETGTKIRASYGTGFKAPTLNDLFFQSSGQDFGNSNLQPEKSKSADVGIDQSLLQDKLKLSVGYFWNHFNNLITFVSDPSCPGSTPGFSNFCPVNVASAKTEGWEMSFKYELIKGLDFRGQYTMTVTRAYGLPGQPENTRLPRWPYDQATLGMTYQPIDTVRINVDYRFVGARNNNAANTPSQRQGSFGVINVSGTYDVTNNWQVFGRVDNLLNEKYEEILYFGTPIRSVYGGVKFTY